MFPRPRRPAQRWWSGLSRLGTVFKRVSCRPHRPHEVRTHAV